MSKTEVPFILQEAVEKAETYIPVQRTRRAGTGRKTEYVTFLLGAADKDFLDNYCKQRKECTAAFCRRVVFERCGLIPTEARP